MESNAVSARENACAAEGALTREIQGLKAELVSQRQRAMHMLAEKDDALNELKRKDLRLCGESGRGASSELNENLPRFE